MRLLNYLIPTLCAARSFTAPTAASAYTQRNAIRDCERHLQRSYNLPA